MKKKRKNRHLGFLPLVFLLVGLCLVMYPKVSDYKVSAEQAEQIREYGSCVVDMDEAALAQMMDEAIRYNDGLHSNIINWTPDEVEMEQYKAVLSLDRTGIMGYVDIPSLELQLPIYHTTQEEVLQTGVGHLPGTALPVGGKTTHCVISGHRGLPSAKLFSDIDRLKEGDVFSLIVLNQQRVYEVDQILVVEPEDTKALKPVEGQEYCTLMTCTPYGINTHRLLVRGHLTDVKDLTAEEISEAGMTRHGMWLAGMITCGVAAIVILILILMTGKKKAVKK